MNRPSPLKTVMAFGTFDRLHPGHISYLKQAKEFGGKLVVVVARDKTVLAVKGRLPRQGEKARLAKVKSLEFIDIAILGKIRDRFAVVREWRPDVVCLGYDQEADMAGLKAVIARSPEPGRRATKQSRGHTKKHGIATPRCGGTRDDNITIVRLKAYKPEVYKSSKMRTAETPFG